MKTFKLIRRDKAYELHDENGTLVGIIDDITIKLSRKDLKPIVRIIKEDGRIEEGFLDNAELAGHTVQH